MRIRKRGFHFPGGWICSSPVGFTFYPRHRAGVWTRRCVLMLVTLAGVTGAHAATTPTSLSFNRDIRPILSENCFQCHGPDAKRRKGDLRLDVREDALEAMAFTPGHAEKSEMIR